MTQRLSAIHPLRTDGQETDNNGNIDAYGIAVIKKTHQKLCAV